MKKFGLLFTDAAGFECPRKRLFFVYCGAEFVPGCIDKTLACKFKKFALY